jgi:hypothetical protein
MFLSGKFALILGLAGAFAALPPLTAMQKDPDAAGVQEAIRFEKAKQAAADRQARVEERNARANSANRSMTEARKKPRVSKTTATARKTSPPAPQH